LIGNQLEEAGWRQGSIIKDSDLDYAASIAGIPNEPGLVLLVASQSCDIAHNNLDADPCIELSVARQITAVNSNFTHNKNPRKLHSSVMRRTSDEDVFSEVYLEFKAFERLPIPKTSLVELQPDSDRVIEDRPLKSYVAWLAARYARPALPTEFNKRINDADPKDKIRKVVKNGNEQLVGIYVEIIPDAEIEKGQPYSVNLLGLLPAGFAGDSTKAKAAIDAYATVMRDAGIEVVSAIKTEDEVSVAAISRFKRFYYDDLSLKNEAPLPPEIKTIL